MRKLETTELDFEIRQKINSSMGILDLLESGDVDRLDVILQIGYLFLHPINADLSLKSNWIWLDCEMLYTCTVSYFR